MSCGISVVDPSLEGRFLDCKETFMPDDFTNNLLALLNGATVGTEGKDPAVMPGHASDFVTSGSDAIELYEVENRFARTICSGMAKIRLGC
jgi:hypothetical protein